MDERHLRATEGILFGQGGGGQLLHHEVVAVHAGLGGGGAADGAVGDLEGLEALGEIVLVARAELALADKFEYLFDDDGGGGGRGGVRVAGAGVKELFEDAAPFGFVGDGPLGPEGGEVEFVGDLTQVHDVGDEDGENGGRALGSGVCGAEGSSIGGFGAPVFAEGANNGEHVVGRAEVERGEGGKIAGEEGEAMLLEQVIKVGADKDGIKAQAVGGRASDGGISGVGAGGAGEADPVNKGGAGDGIAVVEDGGGQFCPKGAGGKASSKDEGYVLMGDTDK